MLLLKYLLMILGIGLLGGAAGILLWDLFQILKYKRDTYLRWPLSKRLATAAFAPLLIGLSIAVIPSGFAGVRVNQFVGTRPATLYPGVHFVLPLLETIKIYDIR